MNDENNNSMRIKILKERHQKLDDEADELSSRPYLSQSEKNYLKNLKVMRLRCKDALENLKAEESCLMEDFLE